jgi:hypothetical protein
LQRWCLLLCWTIDRCPTLDSFSTVLRQFCCEIEERVCKVMWREGWHWHANRLIDSTWNYREAWNRFRQLSTEAANCHHLKSKVSLGSFSFCLRPHRRFHKAAINQIDSLLDSAGNNKKKRRVNHQESFWICEISALTHLALIGDLYFSTSFKIRRTFNWFVFDFMTF